MSRTLILSVNCLDFDRIAVGKKAFEYRPMNIYWKKRLVGRDYDKLVLTRSFPAANATANRLELAWCGYEVQTITEPHFGNAPKPVFAIRVSKRPSPGELSRRKSQASE